MDDILQHVPQEWPGRENAVLFASVLLCTLLLLRYFAWPHKKAQSHGTSGVLLRRPRAAVPPVFPNGWIPVLTSSELAPGQVKPLDVMGESLVAFRTLDGKAHVTDAHCPHLGAHLGVGGRVTGSCIECPFHGWKFDAEDGGCREVPYSTAVPGFARLRTWRTKELVETLFIWYHAEGEDPSWDIDDIPEISRDGWKVRGQGTYIVRCHVQDIVENAADLAHFQCVHSPAIVYPTEDFTSYAKDTWYGRLIHHEWEASCTSRGAEAVLDAKGATSVLGWQPDFLKMNMKLRCNGPAFVVVHYHNSVVKGVMVQMVTPEAPFRVRMTFRLFTSPETGWLASSAVTFGVRKMFERDMSIWENKVFIKNAALVKEDSGIASYRKWYSQFYSESSPTVHDACNKTIEW